jgi:hypothetical protein
MPLKAPVSYGKWFKHARPIFNTIVPTTTPSLKLSAVQSTFYRLASHRLGTGEQTAVDSIHDWLGANLAPSKEAAVQAFDSVLAALDLREFEVDIALSIRVKGDVHHMAVLLLAFGADILLKLLLPGVSFFPIDTLASWLYACMVEVLTRRD